MSKKLFKGYTGVQKKTKVYTLTNEQIYNMKLECTKKAIDEALKYAKVLAANCYSGILEDVNTDNIKDMPSVNEFVKQYESLVDSYEQKIVTDEDLFNVIN